MFAALAALMIMFGLAACGVDDASSTAPTAVATPTVELTLPAEPSPAIEAKCPREDFHAQFGPEWVCERHTPGNLTGDGQKYSTQRWSDGNITVFLRKYPGEEYGIDNILYSNGVWCAPTNVEDLGSAIASTNEVIVGIREGTIQARFDAGAREFETDTAACYGA